LSVGARILAALLIAHVALGLARLPGKVVGRRINETKAYREQGAARFLLASAHIGGADELEWLLEHTDERCVVLWRWPAKGALEFASALLAPRLVVDERLVPRDAVQFAGRPIAHGTVPAGTTGRILLQGTEDRGLLLTTP